MPKPQKVEAVKEIRERLNSSPAALLAEFRGLRVEELKELRRTLAGSGTEFKVVKNTLARIAVRGVNLEDLLPLLEGSTAIAFVRDDPIGAAKTLEEASKKYPALVVKGGLLEGRVLNAEEARGLARVKPREVLLAQLAGLFKSPLQQLAGLLAAPVRNLGYALGAYRAKVEAESPAPPEPETQTPEPETQTPEPETQTPEPETDGAGEANQSSS